MQSTPSERLSAFSWINAALASVMVSCLVVSAGRVVDAVQTVPVIGDAGRPVLAILAFLVALEVQISRRAGEPHAWLSRGWFGAVLVEWTLLILGLIAVVWISQGWEFALADIRALPGGLETLLQKTEYLRAAMGLALAWGCSRSLTGALMALEEAPLPAPKEAVLDPMSGQLRARDRLWENAFLFGGAVILCSIVLPPILYEQLGLGTLPASVGWEVMLYFLCSLVLLTIARLLLLRADWAWERTVVRPGLFRRWILWSMTFLSVIVLLAGLLPTGFSGDLLASLQTVLGGIVQGIMVAAGLVYLYLIMPLLGLFGSLIREPETGADPVLPPELPGLAEQEPPLIDWSWVPAVRELLLWIVILAILVFVFREIFRGRLLSARALMRWPVGRWVLRAWLAIRGRLGGLPRRIWSAAQTTLRSAGMGLAMRTGRTEFGFLRLRDLSNRARIRFLFLAFIRRGTERGYPRRPSQTPREYTAAVEADNPIIREELRELVLAFEEARYSSRLPAPGLVRRIQKVWTTVRSGIHPRKP